MNNPQSGGKTINVILSNPTGGAVLLTPSSLLLMMNDPLPVQPIATNLVDIAKAFTHDAQALSIFVNNAYLLYLKRSPDPKGLAHWVEQLQQGLTDEKLETEFLSSTEYIQKHGGAGQGWVIGMYQDLLGRNPDPSGLAYWTGLSREFPLLRLLWASLRAVSPTPLRLQIFLGSLDATGQTLGQRSGTEPATKMWWSVRRRGNTTRIKQGQNNRTAWIDSAFQDTSPRSFGSN